MLERGRFLFALLPECGLEKTGHSGNADTSLFIRNVVLVFVNALLLPLSTLLAWQNANLTTFFHIS